MNVSVLGYDDAMGTLVGTMEHIDGARSIGEKAVARHSRQDGIPAKSLPCRDY